MVSFGASSGMPEPVDVNTLAKGSFHLTRPSLFRYIASASELNKRSTDVFTWISEGKVKFADFTELPLTEAKRAHDLLEGRATTGKILLKP